MNGIELLAAEQVRVVEVKGWTPEHDDEHTDAELAKAAACYVALAAGIPLPDSMGTARGYLGQRYCPDVWPFHVDWWKPSDDPVRNLVKAGQLIVAEIDRLQRRGGHARD